MDRWTLMAVRMYLPAAAVLLLSLALTFPVASMQGHAILGGIARIAWWGTGAGMVLGAVMAVFATFRLWRWERGNDPVTCDCGGLLGRERGGRYGLYRKCLACGRNVNERHYS